MKNKPIFVTEPTLPSLKELISCLEDIWTRKHLTNNGYWHQKLEKSLAEYLKVPYICLFTNGTIPLIVALKALDIRGEVITTPYSFVATAHALGWLDIKPVFIDIDPVTGNLNPNKIEEAISSETSAILPVHVYGNPCDVIKIQNIANKYNLKVIYDAAHAFGVEINGQSVLNYGDLSTLSFHATKVFNTIEGGAIVCQTKEMKDKIDRLKNFGFENETTINELGINGKLDEVRSAYGLINLKELDKNIQKRKELVELYNYKLKDISAIKLLKIEAEKSNYSYYPIFIEQTNSNSITRDYVYNKLKEDNIFARRYFYPLISDFEYYKDVKKFDLSCAKSFSDQVICLPLYSDLSINDVEYVTERIYKIFRY